MSDRSLSHAWLTSWASRVSKTLKAMTDEFERRHGFPPGTNEVRLADYADQAAARTLAQVSIVPADLVTFYDIIGYVTWADVGNGYFVDPAGDVLLRFEQCGPVDVGGTRSAVAQSLARTAAACPMSPALAERSAGRKQRRWTNPSLTRWQITYGSSSSCWSNP